MFILATLTPAIIIIGKVINKHIDIQHYLNAVPSDIVQPMGDIGFDIWKTEGIDA